MRKPKPKPIYVVIAAAGGMASRQETEARRARRAGMVELAEAYEREADRTRAAIEKVVSEVLPR